MQLVLTGEYILVQYNCTITVQYSTVMDDSFSHGVCSSCLCLQPCKATHKKEIFNNKPEALSLLNVSSKISSDVMGWGETGKKVHFSREPFCVRKRRKLFYSCKDSS